MPRINYVSTNGPGGPAQAVNQLGAEASDYGYVEIGSDGLNQPGSFPFRVDQSGNVTAAGVAMLQVKAATGVNGFALVNGTPTILSWTVPNDGKLHRALVIASMSVTSAETGGVINVSVTLPDGTTGFPQLFAGAQAAGFNYNSPYPINVIIQPGSTLSVYQGTALTAGAAKLWAEIWGS